MPSLQLKVVVLFPSNYHSGFSTAKRGFCSQKKDLWWGQNKNSPLETLNRDHLCCSLLLLLLFNHYIVFTSLIPHGLQHTRLSCPSPSPGVCSNSSPLSWWYYPTISSSIAPFSSRPSSFPASGSFPKSWLFSSGDQSIGVSASVSVLPMNIQDWFPLGLTGLLSVQSKGLSRVLSSTTVQKHQFFCAQPSFSWVACYKAVKLY